MSRRALADLSDAGFAILQQPSMQVNFEVHHIDDRPGYLAGLLENDENTGEATIREALSVSAYGGALIAVTRAGRLSPLLRRRLKGDIIPAKLKINREKPHARVFRGSARPDLSFLYDASSSFDGIVCIEDEPHSPRFRHGQATREVLTFVSDLARGKDAPLLTLQTPVQLPPHRRGDTDIRERVEEWPRTAAIAVRFAISLPHRRAAGRLEIADRLSAFCAERGYGFWLRDARPNHTSGNWFGISDHERDRARAYVRSLPNAAGDGLVSCVLPVTFIGPARVGATHAILSCFDAYPSVSVLACSVTSLDDLTFVYLQFAAPGLDPTRLSSVNRTIDAAMRNDDNGEPEEPTDVRNPPTETVPKILPLLIPGAAERGRVPAATLRGLAARAGDFQSLAGPAFALRYSDCEERRPIWFSWQADGFDGGLSAPLLGLSAALDLVGLEPHSSDPCFGANIEYLVCREVGSSTLRGKGKLSLALDRIPDTFDDRTVEGRAYQIASRLEQAWRAELSDDATSVSVSWRENRLESHRFG